MKHGTLLAASLLFAFALAAQESDEPSPGPDGGTRIRVTGIEVLPVTGRPFSGRSTTEWTRRGREYHRDPSFRDGRARQPRPHLPRTSQLCTRWYG